jgi:hypothetical protein
MFALPPMENSTRLDNMSKNDQEILATQWLTVGQFEEAGELNSLQEQCSSTHNQTFLAAGVCLLNGPNVHRMIRVAEELLAPMRRRYCILGIFLYCR